MKLLIPLGLIAGLLSGCVTTYGRSTVAVYETRPVYGYYPAYPQVYGPTYAPGYRVYSPPVYLAPPPPRYYGYHRHWH